MGGGGARVAAGLSPPGKRKQIFCYLEAYLLLVLHVGAFFATFFS